MHRQARIGYTGARRAFFASQSFELPVGPPPAPLRFALQRTKICRRAGDARCARREGLPAAADLRDTDQGSSKPRRERRIANAIPPRPRVHRSRAFQRSRAIRRTRCGFPCPERNGGNASALSSVRGGRGRQSLARKRDARVAACVRLAGRPLVVGSRALDDRRHVFRQQQLIPDEIDCGKGDATDVVLE